MRNNSYAPHYAISRYFIREFKTGAEHFMVAMIIIIIIIKNFGELISCLRVHISPIFVECPPFNGVSLLLSGNNVVVSGGFDVSLWADENF